VFGLRVDLDRVDAGLAGAGLVAATANGDDRLVVALEQPAPEARGAALDRQRTRAVAAASAGLPEHAVAVVAVPDLPRLPSGKPDLPAIARLAPPPPEPADSGGTDEAALVGLYATLLGRPDADATSTFVGLGGDSLSFVEVSVRLEQRLGRLPDDWPVRTVRELSRGAAPGQRSHRPGWHWLETPVLLRALAIVAIVGTHVGVLDLLGGAHVLVAAAGFAYARFALAPTSHRDRLRRQVRSAARIAVPSVAWIGVLAALTGAYSATAVLLLNGLVGPPTWSAQRHFWFVEILVSLLLVMTAVTAIPWVDRAERRWPFGTAMAVVAAGLVLRFGVVDLGWTATRPVLWLFALGWAAARAQGTGQRVLVSAAAAWGSWGFFADLADPQRDAVILAGVLALVWVRQVPCPGPLVPLATTLAGASLYVYLTHWQLYPRLAGLPGWVVVAACLVAGVLAWRLTGRIGRLVVRLGTAAGLPARIRAARIRTAAPTG
jgi:hypothetical protein